MNSMEAVTNLMMMIPSITAIKTISEAGITVATMTVDRFDFGFSVGETATDGAEDLCMSPVVVSSSGPADTAIAYRWEVDVGCMSWNVVGFCHSSINICACSACGSVWKCAREPKCAQKLTGDKNLLFSTQFQSFLNIQLVCEKRWAGEQ